MSSLTSQPAVEQRRRIASGELSARDLVEATLQRLAEVNPRLNALVTVDESALDQAAALDEAAAAGRPQGLLHGLPVGIKDVTEVGGLRTTYGSPLYADNVADCDALIVERLRAAGAVILGKTNTPEFATGGNTFNPVFGRTRNPWNLERSAGGSTGGGGAALAAGVIALAEGTDLGGSLRIPASFCGVVGLRPSPGLVPTWPSHYAWDTLQVSGGMARQAEDVGLMLQAVAGADPRAPMTAPAAGRDFAAAARRGRSGLAGLRLAYTTDIAGIGIEPDVERVCGEAAAALGDAEAAVEPTELELSWTKGAFLALRGLWMVVQQTPRLEHLQEFGDNLRGNTELGLEVTTRELGAAEAVRRRLWDVMRTFFERYDALLTPCMAIPPFEVTQNYPETIAGRKMQSYVDWIAPTFVLSLTGLPVASVPAGLDASGLPVGLQVVGPPGGEEIVLRVAAAVQVARPIGLPEL